MANQKNKKTKEEFTSLILGMDLPAKTQGEGSDTRVLVEDSDEKTDSIQVVGDTIKIEKKKEDVLRAVAATSEQNQRQITQEVKPSPEIKYDSTMVSVEAALKQAELLRLSQNKIEELEKRNQELIQENEALSASALVLQRKNDQLTNKLEDAKSELKNKDEDSVSELSEKDKTITQLKKDFERIDKKYQELQALMSEKFQSSRRREKELQNRLEILQQEEDVVLTNKDEKILSLKKEIDKHQFELENIREQLVDSHARLRDYKEQVKRSLKALKLASSLLESDQTSDNLLKKTGT